jgi:hypothetical protein
MVEAVGAKYREMYEIRRQMSADKEGGWERCQLYHRLQDIKFELANLEDDLIREEAKSYTMAAGKWLDMPL